MANFHSHIMLCLLASDDYPVTGVDDFIMPLRTNNFHCRDLENIVILGESVYVRKEWRQLQNFTKIHVF